ncbi:MAG: hypothetical protein PUK45_04800 [Clostridia bacterium]|nr:hypothetical protein [Clostridia bacterium]
MKVDLCETFLWLTVVVYGISGSTCGNEICGAGVNIAGPYFVAGDAVSLWIAWAAIPTPSMHVHNTSLMINAKAPI